MKTTVPLSVAALILTFCTVAHAQIVSTGALDTDGSNVITATSGETLIDAITFSGTYGQPSSETAAEFQTVNGDTFTSAQAALGTYTGYTLTAPATGSFTAADFDSDSSPHKVSGSVTTSDAIYPIVSGGFVAFGPNYTSQQPTDLTLTGLTAGTTYTAQLFFSGGTDRTATVSDLTSSSNVVIVEDGGSDNGTTAASSFVEAPVYALETFTATGTSEEFAVNAGGTPQTVQSNGDGVDGNQLDFSSFALVQDAPEPSTWAMMLAGVGLLAYTLRRRKV
jgi:hypothetical protein